MKKIVTVSVLALVLLISPLTFADFNDEPSVDHWVYESFSILQESGLLKGYPDGTFKGYEKASRYEMIELTARVLEFMEEKLNIIEEKKYLTENEVKELLSDSLSDKVAADEVYQAIKTLEENFKDELSAYDLKITTLESEIEALKKALEEKDLKLEKALQDAKTAKIMAIIGMVLGLAGLVSSVL